LKGRAEKREFLEGRVGWKGRAGELDNLNRRALKRIEMRAGLKGSGEVETRVKAEGKIERRWLKKSVELRGEG
jgi:hypothetical protein